MGVSIPPVPAPAEMAVERDEDAGAGDEAVVDLVGEETGYEAKKNTTTLPPT